MAKPPRISGGGDKPRVIGEKPKAAAPDPLASLSGRIWLAGQLARAERDLRTGPGGEGWAHNGSLRAAYEEHAAFLRALLALLTK